MSDERVSATLTLTAATERTWEAIVMGAGPAGALAARQLARQGARVLLLDRARFPRHKVCGCCLNGAALGVLDEVGLGDLIERCGAPPLRQFLLASGGRAASVPLRQGVALSRERLDAELIAAALEAGAEFLDDTQALLGKASESARSIELKSAGQQGSTSAQAIIIATGLGSRVFAGKADDGRQAASASRVGAGAVLNGDGYESATDDFQTGTIYMACHRDGYVGLARLEDGRLDVAAALDPTAIKRAGGIAALVEQILAEAGMPPPLSVRTAQWHGTARLTQRREHVAGDRYFVIGDAAGYVEPFTGEGIAWALATGRAVARPALDCLAGRVTESQRAWRGKHRELLARRMRLCRTVSTLLRYPRLVSIAVRLLARAPVLARPVVKSLNASFASE